MKCTDDDEGRPVPRDEIQEFQDQRSVAGSEACWRTFHFGLFDREPAVERLAIHLPDMQNVLFAEGEERDVVNNGPPATMLTMWAVYLRTNLVGSTPEERAGASTNPQILQNARDSTYVTFPKRHVWKGKWWKPRQRGGTNKVARIYTVHPIAGELYYMRILLHHVTGRELSLPDLSDEVRARYACTLDALRFFGGQLHPTFQDACRARGLLQDDAEWRRALEDASFLQMPAGIRELCVYILIFNNPSDPAALVDSFIEPMGEDIVRQHQRIDDEHAMDAQLLRLIVLMLLDDLVRSFRPDKTLNELSVPFTAVDCDTAREAWETMQHHRDGDERPPADEPREVFEETVRPAAERDRMRREADSMYAKVTDSQKQLVDTVVTAIDTKSGNLFYVVASGGTGKTFCHNLILNRERSIEKIIPAVAGSGISALLMYMGRTFHARFRAPLTPPASGEPLPISAQSGLAQLCIRADAVIFDEATMPHKNYFEALDLTFRDLMQTPQTPFGGKVILLGGDPRQTCTIVKGGSRAQVIGATLPKSYLWPYFKVCFPLFSTSVVCLRYSFVIRTLPRFQNVFDHVTVSLSNRDCTVTQVMHLQENMRVANRIAANAPAATIQKARAFADWLLQLGNGTLPVEEDDDLITIPPDLCMPRDADIEDLIEWVYPNLVENALREDSGQWFAGRCLITVLNSRVDYLNNLISARFPGEETWECRSADRVTDDQFENIIGVDLLNSINPSGFPKHVLTLKHKMPIMLIRNLSNGLCNGTRLSVISVINGRVLRALVTSEGPRHGQEVLIPRITLNIDTNNSKAPFDWSRRQFPVQVAFALSINKTQGQSIRHLGIDLSIDMCFAHGQLYVAFSRVGYPDDVRCFIKVDNQGRFRTRNVVYREVCTQHSTSSNLTYPYIQYTYLQPLYMYIYSLHLPAKQFLILYFVHITFILYVTLYRIPVSLLMNLLHAISLLCVRYENDMIVAKPLL